MVKTESIKEEIKIPDGLQVTIEGKTVHVKGQKGSISKILFHPKIAITVQNNIVQISCSQSPRRKEKALIGTYKAHIRNMIKGVTGGFRKRLDIVGRGKKAKIEGKNLILELGFSHPVNIEIPSDLEVKVDKNIIDISGIDKQKMAPRTVKV